MKFTIEKLSPIKEAFDKINLFKYNLEGDGYRSLHLKKLYELKKKGYTRYQWVSRGDNDVRPSHRFLNGKIYLIDDAIAEKSNTPYPGNVRVNGRLSPREIFGCRCTIRGIK